MRYALPHHRLDAWRVGAELLKAVRAAGIRRAAERDQAIGAALSALRNIGEGVGRSAPADKARMYGIARGEMLEAVIAVECAALAGEASLEAMERCNELGGRLYAMLTKLSGAGSR